MPVLGSKKPSVQEFDVDENPMYANRKSAGNKSIPGVLNKPTGCYFHTRCPIAQDICKREAPPIKAISKTHTSACHFS